MTSFMVFIWQNKSYIQNSIQKINVWKIVQNIVNINWYVLISGLLSLVFEALV